MYGPLFFGFGVFTWLVGYRAGRFASGLAGRLTFAAVALFKRFDEGFLVKGFDVLHFIFLPVRFDLQYITDGVAGQLL
jgi:hypothetical protein